MAHDSAQGPFASLRRPLLIQRFVLTVVVSLAVLVLPLGPTRFLLAATIMIVQLGATLVIERIRPALLDQLGAYLLVEHLIVLAAGLVCPASYVPANMLAIASVGVNAPYLTVRWLRRITPVTVLATVAAPLVHDIDGALAIIVISSLLCAHLTFNRSGAVLLAARAAERAQYEADHDQLTGLANRRVLVTRLDDLDVGDEIGLLLVDLDDFKEVNDNFGHEVGDDVLRAVAERLRRCDSSSLAVRFGGDEFAIMVPGDVAETERVADLVLATFDPPITTGGSEITLSASIGLSHSSSTTPHGLLRQADLAMFAAKRAGGSRTCSSYAATDRQPLTSWAHPPS